MRSLFSEDKWKYLSVTLIGVLATSMLAVTFQLPQQLQETIGLQPAYGAGVLTNVFVMPSDNIFKSESYYIVAFTTATAGTIKTITMTFPSGFVLTNAKLIEVQKIGAGTIGISGQTITYTVNSAVSVPAGTAIKIMIGKIVNGATASNIVAVATNNATPAIIDGPTNSAAFTLIQVTNAMIGTNAVSNPKIQNGAITNSKLAADSVDTNKILVGGVTTDDIANGAVLSSHIRDNDITSLDLSQESVGAIEIQPDAVGTDEIQANAVGGSEIQGVSALHFGICSFNPDDIGGTDDPGQGRLHVNTGCALPFGAQRVIAFPIAETLNNGLVPCGSIVFNSSPPQLRVCIQNVFDTTNVNDSGTTWHWILFQEE